MIAQLAVSAAVFAIDKPYDYLVPADMTLQPGMRVQVPFGRGNRVTEGIVLCLKPGDGVGLKRITACLDEAPVLSERMLHLAAFLRERYFCTFYDAIRAILPAGLWYQAKASYTINPEHLDDWEAHCRQDTAKAVMQAIFDLGGSAEERSLRMQFPDGEALQKALQYLVQRKLVTTQTALLRKTGDKTQAMVELTVSAQEAADYMGRKRRSAPLHCAVLELLCSIGGGSAKEICYFTGASMATLRRLEQLGLLRLYEQPVLRQTEIHPAQLDGPLVLTPEQQKAYDTLAAQMERDPPGAALLYGVTGSGKTSVYVSLMQNCLAQGKTVLLLVPEIALTPQLLSLFAAYFPDQVAVLHSALRVGERYDAWKRIRDGGARVVIGTRSAVFAPLAQLGLIIVDEEQEHTYKSERTPCYHAGQVALYRGLKEQALVVLGSATPAVESMYLAKRGTYTLCNLPKRFNQMAMPQVTVADMKQELKEGNGSILSRQLRQRMRETFARGEQCILFLNRRGSSRMVMCVDCGEVPECPRCSVKLKYHSANGRLMCHYCGFSQPAPVRCPVCCGPLKQIGVGTQKVEQEVRAHFPGVPVLRMDADTISAVNTHEKLLRQFQEEKIPVLIGTQMVTKGLNFDSVTLVGVLDADLSLYQDTYRAAETTFSMLTQVVGRAGRGNLPGQAVIQTMTPLHTVMQQASAQDYDAFYETEIALRQLRRCPPFADLIFITVSGLQESRVQDAAVTLREGLRRMLRAVPEQTELLGPAPTPVVRVNGLYRYRLTLRCVNSRQIRQTVSAALRWFAKDKRNRGVNAFADVNSYD